MASGQLTPLSMAERDYRSGEGGQGEPLAFRHDLPTGGFGHRRVVDRWVRVIT